MKLAAQLYTIRDFTQTEEDIRASLKKIRQIGYRAVQTSAFGPIEPERLRAYLEENDLTLCATHTSFSRIVQETDAVIAEHKMWRCGYVGLGSMPPEYDRTREGYDAFLKAIAPAAERIYDSGLKFLYHNHNFEFAKVEGGLTGMEYLAEHTDGKKFGFLADFYWLQASGVSPTQFIDRYADRLDVVHFKDMGVRLPEAGGSAQPQMAEIFQGNMDYRAIYDQCLAHGVQWAAVEQDVCPGDPFESLKISFDNMKARGMFH